MEENIVSNFFGVHDLPMIKQKVFLLTECLDQLSNQNFGFVFILLPLIDICSS